MSIGTSDGETYPSSLNQVLANLDSSGNQKEPRQPKNKAMDDFREENDNDQFPGQDIPQSPVLPGINDRGRNDQTYQPFRRVSLDNVLAQLEDKSKKDDSSPQPSPQPTQPPESSSPTQQDFDRLLGQPRAKDSHTKSSFAPGGSTDTSSSEGGSTYDKVVNFLDNLSDMKGAEKWSPRELAGYAFSMGMNAIGAAPTKSPTAAGYANKVTEPLRPANDNIPKGEEWRVDITKPVPDDFIETASNKEFLDVVASRNNDIADRIRNLSEKDFQSFKDYLESKKDKSKFSLDGPGTTAQGFIDWVNNKAKTPYEKAVEDQQNQRLDNQLKKVTSPSLQVIEGGRSNSLSPNWTDHNSISSTLYNDEAIETGELRFRADTGKWRGTRINPETNEAFDVKDFKTKEDAAAWVEGRQENPTQEPQAAHKPTPEEIARQKAQQEEQAAKQQKVNVGKGKGPLNDNEAEVRKMLSEGASSDEVAKRFDVSGPAVRQWINKRPDLANPSIVTEKPAALVINGKIYRGDAHYLAVEDAQKKLGISEDQVHALIQHEGFMAKIRGKEVFVSRAEAKVIADTAKQIKEGSLSQEITELMSEDLKSSKGPGNQLSPGMRKVIQDILKRMKSGKLPD